HIDTFGTSTVSEDRILRAINKIFSFQPADIIDQLKLRGPIYSKTTNYGHFGKSDKDLTWEATDKASALKKAIVKKSPPQTNQTSLSNHSHEHSYHFDHYAGFQRQGPQPR